MSKSDEKIRQITIDQLFIKLYHHENVIAGLQEGVDDVTQDIKDAREIKRAIKWLANLKIC